MKHEVDFEGLPEGWNPVAFRIGEPNEAIIDCGELLVLDSKTKFPCLVVEKVQRRRMVLEETDFHNIPQDEDQSLWHSIGNKWWKRLKETDLSDDKLSLSVAECNSLLDLIIARNPPDIVDRMHDFIKDK